MTVEDIEPVKTTIHGIVATSVVHKERTSNAYSVSVANVLADNAPRQLLPNAPSRCRATLIITGTAGDTAFLCDSAGLADQKAGAQIGPLNAPMVVTNTDELWLAAGTGVSIVIGVVAEYG